MDAKLVHPLLISVNVLVVPPSNQTFKENLLVCDEFANASVPISEIGANCERSTTPTNAALDEGGAVCLVPPSPPNLLLAPAAHYRSASATSTISTSSSTASTSSYSSTDFLQTGQWRKKNYLLKKPKNGKLLVRFVIAENRNQNKINFINFFKLHQCCFFKSTSRCKLVTEYHLLGIDSNIYTYHCFVYFFQIYFSSIKYSFFLLLCLIVVNTRIS